MWRDRCRGGCVSCPPPQFLPSLSRAGEPAEETGWPRRTLGVSLERDAIERKWLTPLVPQTMDQKEAESTTMNAPKEHEEGSSVRPIGTPSEENGKARKDDEQEGDGCVGPEQQSSTQQHKPPVCPQHVSVSPANREGQFNSQKKAEFVNGTNSRAHLFFWFCCAGSPASLHRIEEEACAGD